ncbi:DUF2268 domain-containing putative Zn-dependent protease [Bacillus shivajii]|uniref:DUF2268 domain-containing putative Zn-dependent protease n=1 Tax=Bacillus shivajii TaxID=1983719 RepID=UPI001CFB0970|nr:DUF2268 domain-containing putative Zn-dependent protease [Bacillus shivajii]UCZ51544.1 DUF2268 domain-containing putative Zn-dependent protease [Bacillus shivajii]
MDNIELKNLVPMFLNFYKRAQLECSDNETRWELWKELYNFAAVPPGKEGEIHARNLLDDAWEKYGQKITYINEWKPNPNEIENYLTEVKTLLGCKEQINIVVIYFVGGFENNAFVAQYDKERLALCLPIECGESNIILAHELTHIVHSKIARFTGEWERTIASTILQEGLATQVSKHIVPGEPVGHYIEHKKGWLDSCKLMKEKIIKGIFPYLNDSSPEVINKFTFGTGTTNNDREVYFVGWQLVNFLLEKGKTFRQIARIQEGDIPNYLREAYPKLLN